jgi:hypothetical protein
MSKGLFAKLLGATALTAAAAPGAEAPKGSTPAGGGEPAIEPSALTEDRVEAALQAAHAEGVEEGKTAGAKEANDRMTAVFASEEGKANLSMAAWMLGSNPAASAESIIAQLKTCPAQAAAPAPGKAALTTPLAETPKPDLNAGQPAGQANNGGIASGEDSSKIWDSVQATAAARFFGAATGPIPTIAQGGVTAPAFVPTGN